MILKGKNAIITGSSRGIGKSILEVFAKNGANIWACARKPTDDFINYIEVLKKDYNIEITPVFFDLENSDEIKNGLKIIMNSKQKVDVLVNNAGIMHNSLFQMTSMDDLRKIFNVNLFSQFQITQYVIKLMIRQKSGSIVNISSSLAIDLNSGCSAYGASKAAVIAMTKAIALEFAEFNIRANVIAPGITNTDLILNMKNEVREENILKCLMKRVGEPSEIANAALFLASDMSSYMTGQVLRVDGGL